MLTTIDHLALVVRDLDAATAQYSALLGCSPNWRGADGGAEHTWFQLTNMALDLLSPSGPGPMGDRVRARLEQGEGIWAIAFATADTARMRHVLERRGVDSSVPRPNRSDVESPAQRHSTMSALASEATHGTTLFLVQQQPDVPPWPRAIAHAASDACIAGLDHVVITTAHPERAVALYGARLGLEMKLDRTNAERGSRLLFFKCGDAIVEIAHSLASDASAPHDLSPDKTWGISWRATDIAAAHARLQDAGFDVSDVRVGRKPGTHVFTIRNAPADVPTLVLGID